MSKYSKEFKEEALKLSDEIGVKKAALQLGLQYYTLADWRKARKYVKKHTVVLTENKAIQGFALPLFVMPFLTCFLLYHTFSKIAISYA